MRKLLTGAIAATATLAVARPASPSPPTPNDAEADADASRLRRPRPARRRSRRTPSVGFNLEVDKPGTTVEVIEIALPKGTKFSGKGLKKCNADDLVAEGTAGCPSGSKAGPKGTANALRRPGPARR